jgi:hypothetical protein
MKRRESEQPTSGGSEIFWGVLEAARKQLLLDYDKSKGFNHSGIRGDERAEALGRFLTSRLPPVFGVSTGEIIDRLDHRSGQLDLVVYDQTVTRAIYAGSKNEVYPCEAVYAVIEVKSIFTRDEAQMCLNAADKLRRLKPFGEKFVDARQNGAPANDSAHRCMYVVFAFASDLGNAGWLSKEYARLGEVGEANSVSLANIDRLIVLDRGIINPATAKGRSVEDDPAALFADTFLHLANFVERERRRRPSLTWQSYAVPRSRGWTSLNVRKLL